MIFDTLAVGKKFDTWLGECLAIRDSKTIAGSDAYNFYNEEIHIYVINMITYAKDFFDIYMRCIREIIEINPEKNDFLNDTIKEIETIKEQDLR